MKSSVPGLLTFFYGIFIPQSACSLDWWMIPVTAQMQFAGRKLKKYFIRCTQHNAKPFHPQ